MSRGGARANSGPPPDPNALRRDRKSDDAGWRVLPHEGRQGDPPAWPLTESTKREDVLWAAEWARPQAVVWEENGQQVEVAMYVRALAEAEQIGASTNSRTLVKQLQEALGVSLPGMLRLRWKIDKPAESGAKTSGSRRSSSARDRLSVIAGGEATG